MTTIRISEAGTISTYTLIDDRLTMTRTGCRNALAESGVSLDERSMSDRQIQRRVLDAIATVATVEIERAPLTR